MMLSKKKAPIDIGVDLGSRNFRISSVINGEVRFFAREESAPHMRSCFTCINGRPVVGEDAFHTNSSNIIFDACEDHHLNELTVNKPTRRLRWYAEINDVGVYSIAMNNAKMLSFRQQEVIAVILGEAKLLVERGLGTSVKNVVVVVPSFSSQNYRRVVQQAAQIANIESVSIINQSTSAAVAYRNAHVPSCGTFKLGVVSVGARSTEASVFSMSETDIELISTRGASGFGGDDFTDYLAHAALNDIYKRTGGKKFDKNCLMAVWKACEKAKLHLFNGTSNFCLTNIFIDAGDDEFEYPNFTHTEFQRICAAAIARIDKIICSAFKPYKNDITHVMFVGQSTYIPDIKESVKKYVSANCIFSSQSSGHQQLQPELAVAVGAAIKASGHNARYTKLANVSDFAYNAVYATLNNLKVCLIQSHDPIPSKRNRMASLSNSELCDIIVAESTAGHFCTFRISVPMSIWFSHNEIGLLEIGVSDGLKSSKVFAHTKEIKPNILSDCELNECKSHYEKLMIEECRRYEHNLQIETSVAEMKRRLTTIDEQEVEINENFLDINKEGSGDVFNCNDTILAGSFTEKNGRNFVLFNNNAVNKKNVFHTNELLLKEENDKEGLLWFQENTTALLQNCNLPAAIDKDKSDAEIFELIDGFISGKI